MIFYFFNFYFQSLYCLSLPPFQLISIHTSEKMVESTKYTHAGDIVMGILIQSLADLKIILRLDTVTQEKSNQIKELDLQIELEIGIFGTKLLKSETIFRLKISK